MIQLILKNSTNRESYSALLATETAHNILTTVFLPQYIYNKEWIKRNITTA